MSRAAQTDSADVAAQQVAGPDLTACDREPIHVPGAIQPHGLLLIADADTHEVIGGAGDIEGRLTPNWLGRDLEVLLAQDIGRNLTMGANEPPAPLARVPGRHEAFDATIHRIERKLLVELEPASADPISAGDMLATLDAYGQSFERASDLQALCERAARCFRELTGFDRVMIYRFLDDGAGMVVSEDRDPALHSFLNHHFPATDIPRQARQLYIRNRIRVIPDADYEPQPIRPAAHAQVDLSDVGVRSVSPIHVQYLKNMGVAASASVSIVKDGLLWGLVACHHRRPRSLPFEIRAAARTLAGGLARQIRAREEAESYRERIRLRGAEDLVLSRSREDEPFETILTNLGDDLRQMLGATGFAACQGSQITMAGRCPPSSRIASLARWLSPRISAEPFATRELSQRFPDAADYDTVASGLLGISLPGDVPMMLMWFRAEEREVLEWAGNPHKNQSADPSVALSPRASFEAWREEVRGRARAWTLGEVEAVSRLRRQLLEVRQTRRLRELNRELGLTIADKEALILQKDHLLREVNHRVQNSLQLVQSFLGLQARAGDPALAAQLGEAQRRLSAVALVHRRLYQADQVDTVDLARYLDELIGDMRGAMGQEWASAVTLDLSPVLISADRAVNVGLILTELVINANKYAYAGGAGPIAISLEEYRNQFRLIVADQGQGKVRKHEGFGTRMMNAMVQRLDGTMEQFDNQPGLRVIVTAPVFE